MQLRLWPANCVQVLRWIGTWGFRLRCTLGDLPTDIGLLLVGGDIVTRWRAEADGRVAERCNCSHIPVKHFRARRPLEAFTIAPRQGEAAERDGGKMAVSRDELWSLCAAKAPTAVAGQGRCGLANFVPSQ